GVLRWKSAGGCRARAGFEQGNEGGGLAPRPRVRLERILNGHHAYDTVSAEDARDELDDRGKRDAPVQERLHRDLVRGVQHRRSRTAGLEGGAGERHGRIPRLVEREELDLPERREIEARERRRHAIGGREDG